MGYFTIKYAVVDRHIRSHRDTGIRLMVVRPLAHIHSEAISFNSSADALLFLSSLSNFMESYCYMYIVTVAIVVVAVVVISPIVVVHFGYTWIHVIYECTVDSYHTYSTFIIHKDYRYDYIKYTENGNIIEMEWFVSRRNSNFMIYIRISWARVFVRYDPLLSFWKKFYRFVFLYEYGYRLFYYSFHWF